ncbi:MAG: tyrosine-type recombinase/integrase [Scandinavium sp.]|uniref:tyrosine-type recombinase/integrase n=1 Tax=Scandinavium sp. TaxID=2830653 RepID=UPI003F35ABB5
MPLTDKQIRSAKPSDKSWKLADSLGLYLLINPNGNRTWYLKYRFLGKETRISFGAYPDTSLSDARDKRDEARKLIKSGINPSKHRQSQITSTDNAVTFRQVAVAWHTYNLSRWSEGHAGKILTCLERYTFPTLGPMAIDEIDTLHLAQLIQFIDGKGVHDVAGRVRQYLSNIMQHARQNGLIKYNPASDLGGIIMPVKVQHHPALSLRQLPELLEKISVYKGRDITRLALLINLHVFLRSSELRYARWNEFNLKARIWTIPPERSAVPGVKFSERGSKMKDEHLVPLSQQAVELLMHLKEITGETTFVFPGAYSLDKPMSENTINKALRVIGYDTKTEICGHGFRTMACVALNESQKWSKDTIEHQMSHKERNGVRAAYMHTAEHLEARTEMMQWWSDYLDECREGYVAPYIYVRQHGSR